MTFWKRTNEHTPEINKLYWIVVKQTNTQLPYILYKEGLFDGSVWKTYDYGDIDNNNPSGYIVEAFAEIYNYPNLGEYDCNCPKTIREFISWWLAHKFGGE